MVDGELHCCFSCLWTCGSGSYANILSVRHALLCVTSKKGRQLFRGDSVKCWTIRPLSYSTVDNMFFIVTFLCSAVKVHQMSCSPTTATLALK